MEATSRHDHCCKPVDWDVKHQFKQTINQRTNGPVNAHLRPEIYTNKLVIYMYITPGQGQSNLWSQFLF